ncbi:cytochrome P450 [Halieaceae bacterium IMCC14734]|uniref:Cytochrome P450 n=1 Tax=Candidatus Litorirhabdus singularis TaxID=2518993 RepID=A0ABT3TFX6_9GAMM|nr:cytochrome P450 [Candidatus Litorirhabdus singularis]MCX2981207.1 cytochrome P450 [Candidatus Litorirhabdus singularis]
MSGCPHIDLTDPDTYRGGAPREVFRYLRNEEPIYWHEDPAQGVGFWAVTKQKDVDYISKNPLLFSSEVKSCLLHESEPDRIELMANQMINMDPPRHLKYRRLVRSAFTPKKVDSYTERFRQIARDIVAAAIEGGQCEFVKDVAADLPLIAICELMGVPLERRERLFELTNIMIGMDDPELATTDEDGLNAMAEMFFMAQTLAEEHRANPADDIVNVLLTGTVEEEPLTDEEFCHFFLLLIVAGNETTRTVTSHGMRLLIEHPEQYQQLVDNPDLLEGAIEEILRYNPAVIAFRRTATEDVELSGKTIKAGDKVEIFYAAASADEDVFTDVDSFDIFRAEREDVRNGHRAFGVGEHFCLGSHLARLELKVIFTEILKYVRNPRLNGDINWLRSNFISGIKSMPIAFDVADQ